MKAVGNELTVIDAVVLLQPVLSDVYVNVEVPALNPVTNPASVTEAIAGLLLIHVPPVEGIKVVVLPTFIVLFPVMLTVGKGFITTDIAVRVALIQPVTVFLASA
jgi:hypothetical protein